LPQGPESGRWSGIPIYAALSLLWLAAYFSRGFIPIDETRYVTVAWEMWAHDSFIVPQLNGLSYTHKPPLLFWLIHLGWWLFGVNEWWPRLLPMLFCAGAMLLTQKLGRLLWPDDHDTHWLAPLVLVSGIYWLGLSTFLAFDVMFTFFALAALVGLIGAWRNGNISSWFLCGASITLGLLAKGPAILIPFLFTAILLPLWIDKNIPRKQWYLGLSTTVLGAFAAGLLWLAAAIIEGGQQFAQDLLWKATAGRIHNAFAHARPFWWYLPILLIMLLPWTASARWWRGLWTAVKNMDTDPVVRLCLAWIVPTILVFSFISGKQPHYLLPTLPVLALLAVRGLNAQSPSAGRVIGPAVALAALGLVPLVGPVIPDLADLDIDGVAYYFTAGGWVVISLILLLSHVATTSRYVVLTTLASLAAAAILYLGVVRDIWPRLDTASVGGFAAQAERNNQLVGVKAPYYGEYTFAGRLTKPVVEIPYQDLTGWAERNRDALVILYTRYHPGQQLGPLLYTQRLQGRYVSVMHARDVIGNAAIARNCNQFYGNLSCAEKFI